nr:MAG TPA: hypothetical protein [Caudoviricetes sp.]
MSLEDMNNDLKWSLFRGIVCDLLVKHGYYADKSEMSESLDMSFDEIEHLPAEYWKPQIEIELLEYKRREGARFFNVK